MSGTYKVGQEAGLTIYVNGTVTDVTANTVSIEGHLLPTRLGGPVRHLSTEAPGAPERVLVECDHDYDDEAHTYVPEGLLRVIRDLHDATHTGPFRFCTLPVCREAQEGE